MRKVFVFSLIIVCFIFSVNAQKPKPKPVSKFAVQTKVDLGKLSGNTYTNDFFELKIDFPLGWLVGDNVLEAQLQEISQTGMTAQQKKIYQSANPTTPLLGGYKSLPGTPENSNLKIVAENLQIKPQIKTGKDYLTVITSNLKSIKLPPDFKFSEIKTETIDNIPLDYIETSMKNNNKRMYVSVKKGYALLIVIDTYAGSDFDALHDIFTKTDLHYKK